jgi:hypothetical protein
LPTASRVLRTRRISPFFTWLNNVDKHRFAHLSGMWVGSVL